MKTYDTIIIGGGHNGLVTAAYLAKAGKKVLVLEKRATLGGICAPELLWEGVPQVAPVMAGGFLRPDIVRHLGLTRYGLKPASAKGTLIAPQPNGGSLVLSPDQARAVESICKFSEKDAARWPEFVRFMDKAASFLESAYKAPMPRLPKFDLEEGIPLAQMALKLRSLGRKEMYNVIRMLPMTVQELLDEWFESEALKGVLGTLGVHGVTLGAMSAGTGYVFLHNYFNRGGFAWPEGPGVENIITALEGALKVLGAEIRTKAEVAKITVKDGIAVGVVLASGEEIGAKTVISNADPRRTFLSLVGPMELPPHFVWQAQNIKMRGSVAKLVIAVGADPHVGADPRVRPGDHARGDHAGSPLPQGTVVISPSLKYLERAYDASKYGEISEKPYLEITTAGDVVSIHFQFAPCALKVGTWNVERANVEKLAISTLSEYFPNLQSSITNLKSFTPSDLEQTYSLTEGDTNHGQLMLDQFFFMRPIPGFSNHKTPIDGLYLCGSGVHGGGGINGIPGRNAAKIVLKG